jgi:hypothetical protein
MDQPSDFQRAEALAVRLEHAGEALATVLRRPETARRLQAAPGEAEWSALQTLGHVVEMIPYWLAHCRAMMAAGAPPSFGRTLDAPERLAAVDSVETLGPDHLLDRLETEVENAARAIRGMSAAELGKKGIHLRRGEMPVAEVVELLIVAHAEDHLEQVRAALES